MTILHLRRVGVHTQRKLATHLPSKVHTNSPYVRATCLLHGTEALGLKKRASLSWIMPATDDGALRNPSYHVCESMFVGVSMQREFSADRSYSRTE